MKRSHLQILRNRGSAISSSTSIMSEGTATAAVAATSTAAGVTSGALRSLSGGKLPSRVLISRTVFLAALCAVAATLGYLAHRYLTESENQLAEAQFISIADRATQIASETVVRRRLGTVTLASVLSGAFPNASAWPYVHLNQYERISTNIMNTSSGRGMAFGPLITPGQLQSFEEFAYDYFESAFPSRNGTVGVSSFGRGVYGVDTALNTSDNRYHDVDGSTTYGSPNRILFPLLQHSSGPHGVLMANMHNEPARGIAIDSIIKCSSQRLAEAKKRTSGERGDDDGGEKCSAISDMTMGKMDDPAAFIVVPIYPANDPTVVSSVYEYQHCNNTISSKYLFCCSADSSHGLK